MALTMTSTYAGPFGQASQPAKTEQSAEARLFAVVPLCFGSGIGLFFALRFEPSFWALSAAALASAACMLHAKNPWKVFRWPMIACAMILFGFCWAGARTAYVAAPVLDYHYFGPIEGRIRHIDRSHSGQWRVTLDQVRLDTRTTPKRVRVSLHGGLETALVPGMRVMTTGHLNAPGGPVEPGGFDFRRHAWFLQIGGYGWTTAPLLRQSETADGAWLTRQRMALSHHIQAKLPGPEGGVAAALLTGDRSGLTQKVLADLRATNLAHLLAISGLHMGLVAGIVFYAARWVQLWFPAFAMTHGGDRLAAAVALVAATIYFALSGASVATERAYIMTACALCAVLMDRHVLTVRVVALAAVLVLLRRPEALVSPGFQMSFAATLALIAVFREVGMQGLLPKGMWRAVTGVVLASVVAGLATLPFAAAHFNRIPSFGLVANLLSTPLMGIWIMPSGLIALVLAPFGWDGPALWVMGRGIAWILWVADWVSSWPHAVRLVAAPPAWVLGAFAYGGAAVLLWRGWVRVAGLAVLAGLIIYWHSVERPPVLISEDERLVGVMTADGRALSRARGNGFVAEIWLENDADFAVQASAASRVWPSTIQVSPPDGPCRQGVTYLLRTIPEGIECRVIRLPRGEGALAVWPERGRVLSVADHTGARRWTMD